jgi:hypothetical protein
MHPNTYGHPAITTPDGFDIVPEVLKVGNVHQGFVAVLGYNGVPTLNAAESGAFVAAVKEQNPDAKRLFAGIRFYRACSGKGNWPSFRGRPRRIFGRLTGIVARIRPGCFGVGVMSRGVHRMAQ